MEKEMKEYTVYIKNAECCDNFEPFDVTEVIEEFKAHGFNVTEEAIMHNFDAWKNDLKSGYRDDENGYFLFTPCGMNALRFNATELVGEDWQGTYWY
jgi:hypothetical protein